MRAPDTSRSGNFIWLVARDRILLRRRRRLRADTCVVTDLFRFSRSYSQADRDAESFEACWTRFVLIVLGQSHEYEFATLLTHIIHMNASISAALKFLPAGTDIPWHRVISSSGTISSRGPGTDGAQQQREALEDEGVVVTVGRTGEMRVNLGTVGWFPAPNDRQNQNQNQNEDAVVGGGDEAE